MLIYEYIFYAAWKMQNSEVSMSHLPIYSGTERFDSFSLKFGLTKNYMIYRSQSSFMNTVCFFLFIAHIPILGTLQVNIVKSRSVSSDRVTSLNVLCSCLTLYIDKHFWSNLFCITFKDKPVIPVHYTQKTKCMVQSTVWSRMSCRHYTPYLTHTTKHLLWTTY
jgi:hypothetical protein